MAPLGQKEFKERRKNSIMVGYMDSWLFPQCFALSIHKDVLVADFIQPS